MVEWWNQQWVRLHAMVAPAGVLATTLLLTYWVGQWQWQWTASVDRAAGLVEIGAVIYGVIAVAVERGVNVIFWALEERKKRRERHQAELRAEQERRRAEAQKERERLRAEGYTEAKREFDAQLERVAQEARDKGIELDELFPKREAA